ncbi:hypothetical protein [Candidatus Nephthysia bennettiae]|uniref:Uncharacterized protein n=1 Tax=Candidatus Nephthysia bennettiae TaxID=3127016 RepID=A0A934NCN4_9BACT|nr:hypothetical protein [Candidatus Dormibacteraeota bacterium]
MIVGPAGTTVSRLLSAQLVSVNEASIPSDLTRILSLTVAVASGVAGSALAVAAGGAAGSELVEGAGEDETVENKRPHDSCVRVSKPATPNRTPLRIGG